MGQFRVQSANDKLERYGASVLRCSFSVGLEFSLEARQLRRQYPPTSGPSRISHPIWKFPKIRDTSFGPYHRDYSILGSMLGHPYLSELPFHVPTF